jgi:hypothetical protein
MTPRPRTIQIYLPKGAHNIFQRDVLFKSPSGATDTIAGASTNGWMLWKTKDGKTLDELKRQKLTTGEHV